MDAPAPSSGGGDVESARGPVATISDADRPPYFLAVKMAFFFTNIGMMIFLAATAALGIGSATSINDTGVIFVGLYVIIFAGLVTFYELAQVLRWERFDEFMKKNFGFLYGIYGKSFFILM